MNSTTMILLDPIFKDMIWGGEKLRMVFHYPVTGKAVGESWGIAANEDGDCKIVKGPFKDKTLSWFYENHRAFFGNVENEKFPLLVKIIDARQDLSIQVHPDDNYAKEHEKGSYGKMECWYILDCEEESKLVVGHNAKTKSELCTMIEGGKWDQLIREIPVKKGDFIQIAPGTMHAIKGGILLLETQQNSNITYRVYDYGRLENNKPRQLHIKESLDVIQIPALPAEETVISVQNKNPNQWTELITCEYYRVFRMQVEGKAQFVQNHPFLCVTVTEGSGMINGEIIEKGTNLILSANAGNVVLEGDMELIASTANQG
ncbi:MAG: mannose-6-phosphate isomerase, class I [Lachnospiraceae bacterium]